MEAVILVCAHHRKQNLTLVQFEKVGTRPDYGEVQICYHYLIGTHWESVDEVARMH
jgi:hypothetical protein